MSLWRLNAEQEEASRRLTGPVLVDAGAGTGKTRMLAARVVNAVSGASGDLGPVSVEDIVAITFTEKAAGELAERLRRALRTIGDGADQARRLDSAWVLTIHGLCSRVLRANAIEAGVDPHFVIADEIGRARLEERCFEEASLELIDGGRRSLFDVFEFDELLAAVRRIEAGLRVATVPSKGLAVETTADPRGVVERAITCFVNTAESFGTCDLAEDERVRQSALACRSTAETLRQLLDSDLEAPLVAEEAWRVLAAHAHGPSVRAVAPLRQELKVTQAVLLQELAAVILKEAAADLRELIAAYAQRIASAKRDLGALDFDDLQIQAVRLLEGIPELRDRYRERCRLVMVDEFQDTDALQLRLVRLLAPVDLCTVGDERQSIYGFRGAQIDVYRKHVEDMTRAGAPTFTLAENYRSHPAVLEFVNDVFGSDALFGTGFVRLRPARDQSEALDVGATPRVDIVLAPKQHGGAPGGSRRRCARAIAQRFARLRDEHGVPASAMAVLVRAYTHADEYAKALRDEGFPVLVLGGRRFFSLPEVGALRALCRVLANPADEQALGVVLASGLGRVSDASLLRLRRGVLEGEAAGLWEALRQADALLDSMESANASRVVTAIDRATSLIGARPLSEVLLRAVDDFDFDLLTLSAGDEGRQGFANVLKFARMADEYERTEGAGPVGFVEWLELRERAGTKESPASIADDGSQAVRVMSIHAAKGLEFPVVAVPGLGEGHRTDTSAARCRISDGIGELALRLPSAWAPGTEAAHRRTPLFAEMREADISAEADERARLFYVACTRARDVLVLASESPQHQPSSRSMLTSLWSALQWDRKLAAIQGGDRTGPGGSCYRLDVLASEDASPGEPPACGTERHPDDSTTRRESAAGPVARGAEEPDAARPSDERADLEARAGLGAAVGPPHTLSYTGLASFRRCGLRFLAERLLRVGRLADEESLAVRRGSAVHAVLQAGGTRIGADRIAAISRYHDIDEEGAASVALTVEAIERSSAEQDLKGCDRIRREAPFAIPVGEAGPHFLLIGSMDAYGRHGADALVIDYKTGAVSEEARADERRALQAACYSLAAARDGARSVRVVFVHASVDDPGRATSELAFDFNAVRLGEFEKELLRDYESMREGRFDPLTEQDPAYCPSCPLADGVCPAGPPVR